jgi:hypothetical protein
LTIGRFGSIRRAEKPVVEKSWFPGNENRFIPMRYDHAMKGATLVAERLLQRRWRPAVWSGRGFLERTCPGISSEVGTMKHFGVLRA